MVQLEVHQQGKHLLAVDLAPGTAEGVSRFCLLCLPPVVEEVVYYSLLLHLILTSQLWLGITAPQVGKEAVIG